VPELMLSRVFDTLRPAGSGEGVSAIERVGLGMATVMARRGKSSGLLQQVKQCFGLELADAPMRCRFDRVSFIGTGKGKWLAVSEVDSTKFVERLQSQLNGLASMVDQSHAFGILRLSGPALLSTLEKGVQIDLSPEAFPVGRAAVTNIAHLGVILWKVDDVPTFDIAVTRSVAGSFCHWLEASSAAHGLVVHQRPL
jgi:heterotetrameric sarcosine oxidase gamma subunit